MTRPSRLEAVLFDFDGTLCNTEVENLRLVQGILRQMGADVSMGSSRCSRAGRTA